MPKYDEKFLKFLGVNPGADEKTIIAAYQKRHHEISADHATSTLAPEDRRWLATMHPDKDLSNPQHVKECAKQGLETALQMALFNNWQQRVAPNQGGSIVTNGNNAIFSFPNQAAFNNFNNYYSAVVMDNNLNAPRNVARAPFTPRPNPTQPR